MQTPTYSIPESLGNLSACISTLTHAAYLVQENREMLGGMPFLAFMDPTVAILDKCVKMEGFTYNPDAIPVKYRFTLTVYFSNPYQVWVKSDGDEKVLTRQIAHIAAQANQEPM